MRVPTRILTPACVLALVAGALGVAQHAAAQSPDEVTAILADRAAAHGVSAAYLTAIAQCESRLVPTAVGDGGTSFGLAQLHAGGLLDSGPSSFYARGFTDPFNASQAADYLAWAVAHGLASHWRCA